MKKNKNKYDSWLYDAKNKQSRKKIKRLRNKAERKINKYDDIEDGLFEDDYLDY